MELATAGPGHGMWTQPDLTSGAEPLDPVVVWGGPFID